MAPSIEVRPLDEADLPAARRCNKAAFASFLGLDPPEKFRPGADVIAPRWRAWPEAGFAATVDGELAAVGLMMHWGSIAVLGPLTVFPEHQSAGLARRIMPELVALADRTGVAFTGLFTHVHSPKHVRLYEAFGFRMQRITSIMSRPPEGGALPAEARLLSTLDEDQRRLDIAGARAMTDAIFDGLDLTREIENVIGSGIGEALVLRDDEGVSGLAVAHHGPDSEASRGQFLVKFAAVRPGDDAARRFESLLAACSALAAGVGAERIIAGTNAGRTGAYELLHEAGFRADMNGIAMMRPATEGYNLPHAYVIDDWR